MSVNVSQPQLSIIIPTRNGEDFLAQALDSIISQSCENLEIIVIDGLSSDSTVKVASQFAQKYPFIKVISEADTGQSNALNKGIRLAQGEILGLLNDDDFYSPGIFREVIDEFAKIAAPALVIGNCRVYDRDLNLKGYQQPVHVGLENFIFGRQPHPANSSQYFYHRRLHELIGPYPENEHLAMDLWFYLECCSHPGIQVRYVDKHWGNFRKYPGTKTENSRHLQNAIRRKYQWRYLSKSRLLPVFKALPLGFYETQLALKSKFIRFLKKL